MRAAPSSHAAVHSPWRSTQSTWAGRSRLLLAVAVGVGVVGVGVGVVVVFVAVAVDVVVVDVAVFVVVVVVVVVIVVVVVVNVVDVVVMVRVVLVVTHWDAHAPEQSEQLHPSPAVKVWSPLKRSKALVLIDHAGPRHWMATTEAVESS